MNATQGVMLTVSCLAALQLALAQGDPAGRKRPGGGGRAPGGGDTPGQSVTPGGGGPSAPTQGGGQGQRVTIGGQRGGPGGSGGPGGAGGAGPGDRGPTVQRETPRAEIEISPRRMERPTDRGGELGPGPGPGLRDPRMTPPRRVEPTVPRPEIEPIRPDRPEPVMPPARGPTRPRRVEPVAPPAPEPIAPAPVVPPVETLLRLPRVVTPPPPEPPRPPQPYQPPAPAELSVVRGYAPSAGHVILMENFESQQGGQLPQGWALVFSGRGSNAQGVFSQGGNAFFRAAGRANWSAVLRLDLSESLTPVVEFQCRLRRTGGLNSFGIGNGTRCVCYQLPEIGIADNAWHDVLVVVDFAQGASSCSVDGRLTVQRAETVNQDSRAKWSWWGTRPAIVLDSGNQGDQALDIDDIVIQARR